MKGEHIMKSAMKRLTANGTGIQTKVLGGRPVTGIWTKDGDLSKEVKSGMGMVLKKNRETREVEGLFSILGVDDTVMDMIHPGAWTKTLQERPDRFRHLWQHSFDLPPIAKVINIEEIPRNQLPAEVLKWAPDATGGAKVIRRYLTKSDLAETVFEAIEEEALTEMSFAFDTTKYNFEEVEDSWWDRRNIFELRHWETSDVLWGANEFTVGDIQKALQESGLPSLKEMADGTLITRDSTGVKFLSPNDLTSKSDQEQNGDVDFSIIENFFVALKKEPIPEIPESLVLEIREAMKNLPIVQAAETAGSTEADTTVQKALADEEIARKRRELETLQAKLFLSQ